MKHLLFFFGIFLFSNMGLAQSFEEEVGFKYVKAEYLLNTQRFDDAVKELNDIIKQNPSYKNALLLRGETKYKLAAYKGAKLDAMQSIELQGISGTAASILGRSEFAMENFDAALASISAAIGLGLTDEKLFLERADIYMKKSMQNKACEDWNIAARNGSTTAAINGKKYCGLETVSAPITAKPTDDDNHIIVSDKPTNPQTEQSTIVDQNTVSNSPDSSMDNQVASSESDPVTTSPTQSYIPIPEENDTPNEIVIDEDLTLAIKGQGLGLRRILERPSILILSETEGVVTVEICVNENGRVEYAEYNAARSTIDTKSLVSLAVRKAGEFWFERNDYPKQCGFIYFKIKGI